MTDRPIESSLQSTARVAGILYLAIIVTGIFAEMVVRASLIVPGDATMTANNIMASGGFFRAGIVSDVFMIMCDVAVGIAFYMLLRPVNHALALLAAFFRLAQAATLGLNLLNLLIALQLLSGAEYLSVIGADQLHAQALVFLNAHSAGYALALVFFGFSILILGVLIFKSGYIPKILGILLVFASLGYLTDSFARFLLPSYESYSVLFDMIVIPSAFISELAICLWLLLKGASIQQRTDSTPLNRTQADGIAAS